MGSSSIVRSSSAPRLERTVPVPSLGEVEVVPAVPKSPKIIQSAGAVEKQKQAIADGQEEISALVREKESLQASNFEHHQNAELWANRVVGVGKAAWRRISESGDQEYAEGLMLQN